MTSRVSFHWVAVALWVVVIFSAIPFVRRLREVFVARWPAEIIAYAVMAGAGLAAAAGLAVLARRAPTVRLTDAVWLAGIAAVVVLWTSRLMGRPEEAVHFVEYGVLGLLVYRALRTRIDDATVFAAAAVLGTLVGTIDEILQWIAPERYWDFRDVALNGGASALIQLALWRLAPGAFAPVSRRSLRLLCRLAALEVALLTLCLAATPQRLHTLADVIPPLEGLAHGGDVIAEYGHLHAIDDRTLFRSRMTRAELAAEDRSRSREVAGRLDASRGAYREFLRATDPAADPFTYEARVHLFSRNRNLAESRRQRDPTAREVSLTAAFREQLILETAFGATLARSSFAWPASKRARFAAEQDPEAPYLSPVASHLITRIGEVPLRVLMLAAVASLLACARWLGRATTTRRPAPPVA